MRSPERVIIGLVSLTLRLIPFKPLIRLIKESMSRSGDAPQNCTPPIGVVTAGFARRVPMTQTFTRLWDRDEGQDIAEYAVMLAVILIIVLGTVRLIGTHANTVFSNVASSIQ